MSNYSLVVPDKAESFKFSDKTYKAGDQYQTDDPCDAIAFYNAARSTNAKIGRVDNTANFWESMDGLCSSKTAADPKPELPTLPDETNPLLKPIDNAAAQGAPAPPLEGNLAGNKAPDVTGEKVDEPTRPAPGEPHPNKGGEQAQEKTNGGDPVDLFRGSLYLSETDLTIPNTIIPLSFTRIYLSGAASYGPFGWNWDHNFNVFIRTLNTGDVAVWRNLHEDIFKINGSLFEPPSGVFELLNQDFVDPDIYEIRAKGGLLMHFERPSGWMDVEKIPLCWIKDRHGNLLRFAYGAEDKLTSVIDKNNRGFSFAYDQCGLLVELSDQAGRRYHYQHDEETMQLTFVRSPAIAGFPNGITRIYSYEQADTAPELRHNITGIEDAEGNIYLENNYEQDPASWNYGKIIGQSYGGYIYQFEYTQLQWVPANVLFINIPAVQVEVLNPDYGLETYSFNYRGDLLDRRYRLMKDKSFRVVAWQYAFDEQGNPSRTQDPSGAEELLLFDFAHADPRMRSNILQKELTAAAGFPAASRIIWKANYESRYQLLSEEKNEQGAVTTYKYDYELTPAALDNSGKLIKIIQPDVLLPNGTTQKASTSFSYNTKGQITGSSQPDGTNNVLEYGVSGEEKDRLVAQHSDVGGLNIQRSMRYDSFGYITETKDGNGFLSREVYNALGLPEKTILPAINGLTPEYRIFYNADKKAFRYESPKGDSLDPGLSTDHIDDLLQRDVLGRVTRFELAINTSSTRTIQQENDYRGLDQRMRFPDGSRKQTRYDERGLLLSDAIIGLNGEESIATKAYDRAGNLISEKSAFGLITKYEYDGFARRIKVILPNGTEIRNTWLKGDLLGSQETFGDDGEGLNRQLAFKSYTYDKKDRRITETIKCFTDDPSINTSITSTQVYDAADRVVQIINHLGGVTSKQYDGLGRLIQIIDPEGNKQNISYDKNGNTIELIDSLKNGSGGFNKVIKKYRYDARNRRVESIDPDGSKLIVAYDDRNLLVRHIDQLGIVTENTYSVFQEKLKEVYDTTGLAIVQEWTFDNMSRITAFIDPEGEKTTYAFDELGRSTKTTNPNGFSSIKTFNAFSQIETERLTSGAAFSYSYDKANRVIKIVNSSFPGGLQQVEDHQFQYDGLDRVVHAKAGTAAVSRRFDSQGRLLSETTMGQTLACRYDDAVATVEKIWPDGRTEILHHDLNGQLSKIEQTVGGSLGASGSQIIAFKPNGPTAFRTVTVTGGLDIENSYDDRNRLTDIAISSAAGTNAQIKYRYNRANIKQVEAILGQNQAISLYNYDAKYRLTQALSSFASAVPASKTQQEHDKAINLVKTSAIASIHQEDFTYNAADARISYTETGAAAQNYHYFPGDKIKQDGLRIYSHSSDGTLTSDGNSTFLADAFGRIVAIKVGASTITEIRYDAFGRPSVLKESGHPEKSLLYFGGFVEQENENGTAARQITMLPVTGIPLAYHSALGIQYPLFDGRFNLVGLYDQQGKLLESYRYKSFGLPTIFNKTGAIKSNSDFGVSVVFGGQTYLSVCGLYLSKKRLMNPINGLYLSPDPKGYQDSPAVYSYAMQNPINYIDPNGEVLPLIAAAVIIGALIGAGYCIYDAYSHPDSNKYDGWGALKVIPYTFGGAAIGGAAVVGGESVLAVGGTGIFAAEGTAVTLTATQSFLLYGTASATTGAIGRTGFNAMFPEYVDPVSAGSVAGDFVLGGGLRVFGPAIKEFAEPLIGGARQMFQRSAAGPWRIFGDTWRLIRPRSTFKYSVKNIFSDSRTWNAIQKQYWRGQANGNSLQHLWTLRTNGVLPQQFRNAGWNLIEVPKTLNTWMGDSLARNLAFRGIVASILAATGTLSYTATSHLINSKPEHKEEPQDNAEQPKHPNFKPPGTK
jgi:RHS repeat-associated protein